MKRLYALLSLLVVASMLFVACAPVIVGAPQSGSAEAGAVVLMTEDHIQAISSWNWNHGQVDTVKYPTQADYENALRSGELVIPAKNLRAGDLSSYFATPVAVPVPVTFALDPATLLSSLAIAFLAHQAVAMVQEYDYVLMEKADAVALGLPFSEQFDLVHTIVVGLVKSTAMPEGQVMVADDKVTAGDGFGGTFFRYLGLTFQCVPNKDGRFSHWLTQEGNPTFSHKLTVTDVPCSGNGQKSSEEQNLIVELFKLDLQNLPSAAEILKILLTW